MAVQPLLFVGALTLLVCTSPVQQDTKKLTLEAGDHAVYDLMQRSGEYLGRSYLVDVSQNPALDPAAAVGDRSQQIRLSRRVELDRVACEELIGKILRTKGWVAIPVDAARGVYDWIWLQGPRGRDIKKGVVSVTPEELRKRPNLVQYVSTTVVLKHGVAQLAAANLRTTFTDPRGLMTISPTGTHTLLVTGFRPEVIAVLDAIAALDIAPKMPESLARRLSRIEARLDKLEGKK